MASRSARGRSSSNKRLNDDTKKSRRSDSDSGECDKLCRCGRSLTEQLKKSRARKSQRSVSRGRSISKSTSGKRRSLSQSVDSSARRQSRSKSLKKKSDRTSKSKVQFGKAAKKKKLNRSRSVSRSRSEGSLASEKNSRARKKSRTLAESKSWAETKKGFEAYVKQTRKANKIGPQTGTLDSVDSGRNKSKVRFGGVVKKSNRSLTPASRSVSSLKSLPKSPFREAKMATIKKKKSISRSESKVRPRVRKEKKLVCTSCRKSKSPSKFGRKSSEKKRVLPRSRSLSRSQSVSKDEVSRGLSKSPAGRRSKKLQSDDGAERTVKNNRVSRSLTVD